MKKLIYCLIVLIVASCGQKTNNEESAADNMQEIKSVSELTYSDIVDATVTGEGIGIEYHGEPTNTEALQDVAIERREETCGDNDCGQVVYIMNKGFEKVKALIRSPFRVEAMDSYAARYFILEPGTEALVGCSDFCYGGKSYPFTYEIVGAEYHDGGDTE